VGHADTNFMNADLGTCMDYTNRPRNNLNPNRYDFIKLGKLYGGKKFMEILSKEEMEEEIADNNDIRNTEDGNTEWVDITPQEPSFSTAKEANWNKNSERGKNGEEGEEQNTNGRDRRLLRSTSIDTIQNKQRSIFSYSRSKASRVTKTITNQGEHVEIWTYYTPA